MNYFNNQYTINNNLNFNYENSKKSICDSSKFISKLSSTSLGNKTNSNLIPSYNTNYENTFVNNCVTNTNNNTYSLNNNNNIYDMNKNNILSSSYYNIYLNNIENNKINYKYIIVCDDCKSIRQSQIRLLYSLINTDEYCIIECFDGIDILKISIDFSNKGYDISLILTDENMEYMNGSESINILNNLSKKGKIKKTLICSVTAFEDSDTKSKIYSKGISKIFSKPLSKEELEQYLKQEGFKINNKTCNKNSISNLNNNTEENNSNVNTNSKDINKNNLNIVENTTDKICSNLNNKINYSSNLKSLNNNSNNTIINKHFSDKHNINIFKKSSSNNINVTDTISMYSCNNLYNNYNNSSYFKKK